LFAWRTANPPGITHRAETKSLIDCSPRRDVILPKISGENPSADV